MTSSGKRRAETAAIAAYLKALRDPDRSRSAAKIYSRLASINTQLGSDVLKRLDLLEERRRLQRQLLRVEQFEFIEQRFIERAASFAARAGICRHTFREFGISPSVLRQAGIAACERKHARHAP